MVRPGSSVRVAALGGAAGRDAPGREALHPRLLVDAPEVLEAAGHREVLHEHVGGGAHGPAALAVTGHAGHGLYPGCFVLRVDHQPGAAVLDHFLGTALV